MKHINQVKKYLSPDEAGRYIQISPRTLAKWRCVGTPNIPYTKVGRSVRYKLEDLDNYLAKHSFNSVEG
jgi:excisionase family DNA binding protein